MNKIIAVLIGVGLSISAFSQSQGVSMRATNGIGYGNTVINNLIGKVATGGLTNASGSRVAYLSDTNGLGSSGDYVPRSGTNMTGGLTNNTYLAGNAAGLTNIQPQNIISNGQQIVNGVLSTNSLDGGFYTQTGDKRKLTLNGSGLTNIGASSVSGVYASNVTSGGVLPAGTVSASTATAGYVLATDGTLRQWTNRVSLAQIDGIGGVGSTNVTAGRIISTNVNTANTFLDINGAINGSAGNFIEYKTNNVSKFSVTTLGGLSANNIVLANGMTAGSTVSTTSFLNGGAVSSSSYIAVTNFFFLRTNYVAANFVPIAGHVIIASSNGALFSVTQLSTNLIAGP